MAADESSNTSWGGRVKQPAIIVASLFAVALAACVIPAMAADDRIPATAGFSGNVIFGVGVLDLESNVVAGNKLLGVDNKTISSLNASPQSATSVYPMITGEVRYTFSSGWQAFFGSSVEDLLTLDFSQRLGVRKAWDRVGVMGLALMFSGTPAEVWADPYLVGVPRSDTARDANGLRLDWWRMFDSNFFLQARSRKIRINNEQSGTDPALGLTPAEISSLRRNGNDNLLTVGYRWFNGTSLWQPEISFGKANRDGNAVSNDMTMAKLTYSYWNNDWVLVASGLVFRQKFDNANPVFGQKTDANSYALTVTAARKLTMGGGNWRAFASAAYGRSNADVNFFDIKALGFNLGLQYGFGAQ
jgi:hypothetical protein